MDEQLPEGVLNSAIQPRLTLDLTPKAAKALENAKPGLPIVLVVKGVVTDLTLRDDPQFAGCICVDVSSAKMSRDHQNAVADMFYEDDGPEDD
jgi:hypothetical protein